MHQLVTALAPMTSLNYLDLSITDLMAEPKADYSRADLHLAPLPSIRQLTVNADTEDSLQFKRRIDAYGVNRLFPNALAGVIIRYLKFLHVFEVAIVVLKGVGWRHRYLAYVFCLDRWSKYITDYR